MLAGVGECAGVVYECVARACNTCFGLWVMHAAGGGRSKAFGCWGSGGALLHGQRALVVDLSKRAYRPAG